MFTDDLYTTVLVIKMPFFLHQPNSSEIKHFGHQSGHALALIMQCSWSQRGVLLSYRDEGYHTVAKPFDLKNYLYKQKQTKTWEGYSQPHRTHKHIGGDIVMVQLEISIYTGKKK